MQKPGRLQNIPRLMANCSLVGTKNWLPLLSNLINRLSVQRSVQQTFLTKSCGIMSVHFTVNSAIKSVFVGSVRTPTMVVGLSMEIPRLLYRNLNINHVNQELQLMLQKVKSILK